MSDSAPGGPPSHPAWDDFSRRQAGSPFLAQDPLYALSEPLIDAIKREVPGFFTADEERFERDLARTASLGFFLRRPLGATAGGDGPEGGRSLDERTESTSHRIDQMLREELRRTGADDEDVDTYFERGAAHREKIESRQGAYIGWLVMNPAYRAEVRQFRERWGDVVRAAGRFPRLPLSWVPDPTDEVPLPPGFRDDSYRFFCRWGLDTLATWDWPVPMEPDLSTGLRRDMDLLSTGGMVVFVPWYLLRGGVLDWRDVVHQSRLGSAPDHLSDWVNKRAERRGHDLGDVRYDTVRWLYRYDELVLARRYAAACAGNRTRLDYAFAGVIGRGDDTIKKGRLELRASLGAGQ